MEASGGEPEALEAAAAPVFRKPKGKPKNGRPRPREVDDDEGQGWELQRLSWARAIGVFWVYAGWLILDLVAL